MKLLPPRLNRTLLFKKKASSPAEKISVADDAFLLIVNANVSEKSCLQFSILTIVSHMVLR